MLSYTPDTEDGIKKKSEKILYSASQHKLRLLKKKLFERYQNNTAIGVDYLT